MTCVRLVRVMDHSGCNLHFFLAYETDVGASNSGFTSADRLHLILVR